MSFGHKPPFCCFSAQEIRGGWAVFHSSYSVCPKDENFRFYYRFIRDLLGKNVGFYELVPNMVIMDKRKQVFDDVSHADTSQHFVSLSVAAFAVLSTV